MELLVIDGQGGRMGQQLIRCIRERYPQIHTTAVGTNSMATAAMLKGGAHQAATGEHAVLVACRQADVLLGEISPDMAIAVGQSRARKILLPIDRCNTLVVGVGDYSLSALLECALEELGRLLEG